MRSTEDRWERARPYDVTVLFTRVTDCKTMSYFFFQNGGTSRKKRRNSNKNGELRVPKWGGTRLGRAWDIGHVIRGYLPTVNPPSMINALPVTKAASSLAR